MADQQIPDSGAAIKEVVPTSWQKGKCPPSWVPTETFTEEFTKEFA